MARWSRNPPSKERIIGMLVVVGISLALFGYERIFGWPEALTPDPAVSRGRK
jgi:hypothetical protein